MNLKGRLSAIEAQAARVEREEEPLPPEIANDPEVQRLNELLWNRLEHVPRPDVPKNRNYFAHWALQDEEATSIANELARRISELEDIERKKRKAALSAGAI